MSPLFFPGRKLSKNPILIRGFDEKDVRFENEYCATSQDADRIECDGVCCGPFEKMLFMSNHR